MLACAVPWLLATASGCGAGLRRMPPGPVLWDDPDRTPFSPPPAERYVSWRFDAVDHLFLRPASEAWTFRVARPAINVNALDEVPSSSWFQNRIGRSSMTPEELARGACERLEPDVPFPWTVVGGKPDGTNPGFTIEDAHGTRYLLKTDGLLQPERASAADAIAATLFHAAGYYVPCNRVVYFDRADLRLARGATAELVGGAEVPLTEEHVDAVLRAAARDEEGHYRAALSRFVEGTPLGPWSYESTLRGDPNDVVPHTDRRDLRGLYVLFAWTGHIDARQENTLASWIERGEAGYVRHYLIDFGDCFGVLHESEPLSRRFEHDHYLDLTTVLLDYLSAGLVPRPWQDARLGPAGRTLGFYDARRFVPDAWAPGYPNPAFDAHTEHDAAWMARIVARISPDHVRAAVRVGRFSDPIVERELTRVLLERRARILERYLSVLSPLAWPTVEGERLCLEDLAVEGGIRASGEREHAARIVLALPPRAPLSLHARAAPDGRVCVELPRGLDYLAVDLGARTPGRDHGSAARLHLYRGPSGHYVSGLERLHDRGGLP